MGPDQGLGGGGSGDEGGGTEDRVVDEVGDAVVESEVGGWEGGFGFEWVYEDAG